jgi:hypothetical protein
MCMARRRDIPAFKFNASVAALIVMTGSIVAQRESPTVAAPPDAETPIAPRAMERIEPGTLIVDSAPIGWSHFVAKTQSVITQGDIQQTPAATAKFVNMFFTAMLVKASRHETQGRMQYELDRAAIGLGTSIAGKDTIISSATYRKLGADIGEVGGIVLGRLEEQLAQVVEVARSSTMALVDVPIFMLREQAHVQVVLRYALLIDPRDGRSYTLVWILDRKDGQGYQLAADSPLILVKPNLVKKRELHVDATKIFLGIPALDAFAIVTLPPGVPRVLPDAVKKWGSVRQFTPQSTFELETGLWQAIFAANN